MEESVRAFATTLRDRARILGPLGGIEWRVSADPVLYEDSVLDMEARAAAIAAGEVSELIWFLEHPSLYTAGTSAKPSDLLDVARFPIHPSGRGGQYTYHGPGQLVAYVLFDLGKRGRDVRHFVQSLEAWVIAALADWGIKGERRDGSPGIWVSEHGEDAKIAAVGVRVRRWVTYHGIAINIDPDLSHFSGIVPCGISDAGVTSIASIRSQRAQQPQLLT